MTAPSIDVEAEADRLYQLPLADFIRARNALAARLKSSGDKDGAARVKALARPNLAAWAANQVYWTARLDFDRFMASAQRLSCAQAEGASGEALREAIKMRREARAAVMARAESVFAGAGHGGNPAALRSVSNTLEALASGSGPTDLRLGRLVHDLELPGFEAVARLVEASPPVGDPLRLPEKEMSPAANGGSAEPNPHSGGVDGGDRIRRLERARAALTEAERRLEDLRREVREAGGAQSLAQKRADGARGELEELTRRFERAKERARQTAADESAAQDETARLASVCEAAEATRDAASQVVRALE